MSARSTELELVADSAYFARGEAIEDIILALEDFTLASDLIHGESQRLNQ
jgi:predicted DNA-binding protein